MLSEAYHTMYEAPTDPGPSFDDKMDTPEVKYIDTKDKMSEDDRMDVIDRIIDEVKNMLRSHEGSHFPGSFKDFREEIVEIIRDIHPGISKPNAGYSARVIQNVLRKNGVIQDEKSKGVKVNNVSDEVDVAVAKAVEPEVQDDESPESVTAVQGFQLHAEYTIDREIPATLSDNAKHIHSELMKAGLAFGKHPGKHLVDASGLPYTQAKGPLSELEAVDVISREHSDSGDVGDIEALGPDDGGMYAAQDYADKYFDIPSDDFSSEY